MSASAAPFPTTKPEKPNLSNGPIPRTMHRTNADFWKEYWALSAEVRKRADKQFALLNENPRHPSLQLKKLTEHGGRQIWSARVTLKYRALAVRIDDDYVWFWIGEHDAYSAFL
jgi:mRNA-degrading endonuclease RelE of RelBE toxin-antitoxin system